MHFLSPEVQLDIFKWLTFKQLISIQQTNSFYKIFLNKYEDKLARKRFDKLEILYGNDGSSSYYEFFEPDPSLYEFQLSEQVEKKWKCAIENSIPMFLSDFDTDMNIAVCELGQDSYHEESYYSQLPNLPKNVEDMKIARYILEQLFNCCFEFVQLDKVIFNPQMIKLLFDENKANMPLLIHSQSAHLFVLTKSDNCLLEFILNHLISKEFTVDFWKFNRRMQNLNILFKILTTGEDKFGIVSCRHVPLQFYNDIIKHIETAENISKMVKEIRFGDIRGTLNLIQSAENVEKKVGDKNLKSTKYQLSNKHNPEMKFCVYTQEVQITYGRPSNDVEIKRMN